MGIPVYWLIPADEGRDPEVHPARANADCIFDATAGFCRDGVGSRRHERSGAGLRRDLCDPIRLYTGNIRRARGTVQEQSDSESSGRKPEWIRRVIMSEFTAAIIAISVFVCLALLYREPRSL